MSGWFISDHAITSPDKDLFDHDAIAEGLVNAIRSEPSALCVGLIGGFGSGKTSITNLAISRLGNDRKLDPIRVSADRHSGVARSRNIVHSVASELDYLGRVPSGDIRKALRPLTSAVSVTFPDPTDIPLVRLIKGDYGAISWRLPLALCAAAILLMIASWVFFQDEIMLVFWLLATTGILSASAAFSLLWSIFGARLRALFSEATVQDATPRAEASDDVERVFARIVELHFDKQKHRRLVIFVDDIDRLDPNDVLDALRAIKSLQSVPKGKEPVFVVSCDDQVIVKAIAKSDDAPAPAPNQSSAARSFLEKFFNLRIVLPLPVPGDMRDFASKIVQPDHPIRPILQEQFEQVIRIIISEDIQSPRKVIRRLNDYFSVFQIARLRENKPDDARRIHEGDVTGSPALLARIIVLREEFPNFFIKVVEDHNLLESTDRLLLGRPLSEAQLDVLERHQLIGDSTSDELGASDGEGQSNGSTTFHWKGDQRLRSYLLGTVRYLPPGYPGRLTPLIYLSHSPSGRLLGNARISRLVAAVRGADAETVHLEVRDTPPETHETIATELAGLIDDTPAIDLANVIAGATAAIPVLASGGELLADASARALRRATGTVVSPKDLAVLLDHSSNIHRDALQSDLVQLVPTEGQEDREERMLLAAEYLSRTPAAETVQQAVEAHLGNLHQTAGWEDGRRWLASASQFPRPEFSNFLDNSLLPALIRTAREAKTFSLDTDAPPLVQLAAVAKSADATQLLLDISSLTESDPTLLTLAARLVEALNPPGTVDGSEVLARAVGESTVDTADRKSGIVRLATWAPVWADALLESEDDDAPNQLAVVVAESVAAAAQSSDELAATAQEWLTACAYEVAPDALNPVVVALLERIIALRDTDADQALARANVLLSILDELDDTTSEEIIDQVLAPLEARGPIESPSARFALGTLGMLADTDVGQQGLARKATIWRNVLVNLGRTVEISIKAFNQLSEVAPNIYKPLEESLFQQIASQGTSRQNAAAKHLHVIASVSWHGEELRQALVLLEQEWSSVSADDKLGTFKLLGRAVEQGVEAPGDLFQYFAERVINEPRGDLGDVAASAWAGFTPRQRAQMAATAYHDPDIQEKLPLMSAEELSLAYTEAIKKSSLNELVEITGGSPAVVAEAAHQVLMHSVTNSSPLDSPVAKKLSDLLGEGRAKELSELLLVEVPAENPKSLAAVRILNCLNLPIERREISDLVSRLLPEADEALAFELGKWEGKARLPRAITDVLKDLRTSGRHSIASQFELGQKER